MDISIDVPSSSYAFQDLLLILGVLIAISIGLFILVGALKGGRSESRRHRRRHRSSKEDGEEETVVVRESRPASHDGSKRRRKFRKRRKEHRPRNPTLSETGGLPPPQDVPNPPPAE